MLTFSAITIMCTNMYKDRHEAGVLLAESLHEYLKAPNTIVLGLPRGGVVTAAAISEVLELPLDVLCIRKVGAPFNQELALGAVGSAGEPYLNSTLIKQLDVSPSYIEETIQKERAQAQARVKLYCKNHSPLDLENKTVILVDDGLATGATMKAALAVVQAMGVEKVVVAVPVSSPETLQEIEQLADQVICLEAPFFFQAVGQFYDDFSQTEDDEVIRLLNKSSG